MSQPNIREPQLQPGDAIVFELADRKAADEAHQMVTAMDAPGILKRKVKDFRRAAQEGRLIIGRSAHTGRIVATAVAASGAPDPTNHLEIELATLAVHPGAQRHGLARVLAQLWVARYVATAHYGTASAAATIEWVAKVWVHNEGPEQALQAAGFEQQDQLVELDPRRIRGIDQMLQPGEDRVYARAFRFDLAALDRVLVAVHQLLQRGEIGGSRSTKLKVVVDRKLIDHEAIKAHVELLAAPKAAE